MKIIYILFVILVIIMAWVLMSGCSTKEVSYGYLTRDHKIGDYYYSDLDVQLALTNNVPLGLVRPPAILEGTPTADPELDPLIRYVEMQLNPMWPVLDWETGLGRDRTTGEVREVYYAGGWKGFWAGLDPWMYEDIWKHHHGR